MKKKIGLEDKSPLILRRGDGRLARRWGGGWSVCVGTGWAVEESVHRELITQVVENVVGGRGEAAGVG